ncbi:MAG: hypothetical protein Q9219_007674, partial [cf. Caloplaca sp. 3 TL-2023]
SDADSDVLGDYVLALIRAETPEPELRLSAIANLEDFLQEKAERFVDETFQALHNKSFKPGYVPPVIAASSASLTSSPPLPTTYSASRHSPNLSTGKHFTSGAIDQSRKRSYTDQNNRTGFNDMHYMRGDRQTKQPRREGPKAGQHDAFNGRSLPNPPKSPHDAALPGQFPFPGVPPPSADPHDPLMAMMLQAMGLPMPPVPQNMAGSSAYSPTAYSPPFNGPPTFNSAKKLENRARCRDYDTKGFCVKGISCPFEHGNDHVVAPGQEPAEYDPKNSAITEVPVTSPRTNELGGQDMYMWGTDTGFHPSRGRREVRDRGGVRHHVSSRNPKRAEFSHAGPNFDRSITTIVVENIPEDKFDEQSVREFFSAFGTITNLDMRPYKHLAIVTYGEYGSARSAYESPRVIFDNRFVKVYWYKAASNLSLNGAKHDSSAPATSAVKEKEAEFDKEQFERNAEVAQKKLEEKRAMIKEGEMKRQALEQQKEELAQKQAEEKRKLQGKLAARGASSSAKPDVASDGLDSHAGNAETSDDKASAQTKALRAQVAALEAEARSLGLDTALTEDPWPLRGRGRDRGTSNSTYRGSSRGRGGFIGGGAYNLDNRTRRVSVSGIKMTADKDEALRQHLFAIGEFDAIEPHAGKPDTQIVTFKDRKTAERFMYGVKTIPSVGTVELAWVNAPLPPVKPAQKEETNGDAMPSNGHANGNQHPIHAENTEVDYDVAEEDDRWMAS